MRKGFCWNVVTDWVPSCVAAKGLIKPCRIIPYYPEMKLHNKFCFSVFFFQKEHNGSLIHICLFEGRFLSWKTLFEYLVYQFRNAFFAYYLFKSVVSGSAPHFYKDSNSLFQDFEKIWDVFYFFACRLWMLFYILLLSFFNIDCTIRTESRQSFYGIVVRFSFCVPRESLQGRPS